MHRLFRFTAQWCHAWLCLLAAALLPAAGAAAPAALYDCLAAQPSGQIHFLSVTPKSRYELAHRGYDGKGTEVWGQLDLPKEGKGPFPAMVIAHGSAGVQRKDLERWVPLFNQMGIATLLVDSFKPRGIGRTDEDQSQLDQAANDADALSALKLLTTDPRIDASRIGVIGFSRGGTVALDTSVDTFRKGVIDGDLKFAAHIAFYPGCTVRYWRTPSPLTGAPIMMALGGKDDYTPARPCVAFGEAMKAAGQDVEVHVYPGAYHDFDSVTDYGKRLPHTETSRDCPDREIDPVAWKYRIVGSEQSYRNFGALMATVGNRVTRGVNVASDFGAAKQAEDDVRVFIRRAFRM